MNFSASRQESTLALRQFNFESKITESESGALPTPEETIAFATAVRIGRSDAASLFTLSIADLTNSDNVLPPINFGNSAEIISSDVSWHFEDLDPNL
mmetsp:Transcript_10853/g.16210  ORF Transcript_10853/g.16210 Transcript_10853/m.16210 type:complete len:97 (-) Transcript_10853:2485-2775(-)